MEVEPYERKREAECDACDGKGGSGEVSCSTCGGRGRVVTQQRTPFGVFQSESTCPDCRGKGKSFKNICKSCHGEGHVIKKKEIESSKYYSELNSTIQQSITNYSLVKSFANEDYEYEKFKEINDKKENNNYYINNLHCRYWLISDMITSFYNVNCLYNSYCFLSYH